MLFSRNYLFILLFWFQQNAKSRFVETAIISYLKLYFNETRPGFAFMIHFRHYHTRVNLIYCIKLLKPSYLEAIIRWSKLMIISNMILYPQKRSQ